MIFFLLFFFFCVMLKCAVRGSKDTKQENNRESGVHEHSENKTKGSSRRSAKYHISSKTKKIECEVLMFGKVFVSYIRTRIGFKPLSTIYTPVSSSSHSFDKEACFPFKKWHELNMSQKQEFIQRFVKNYRHQYPSSKTNVSLKGLSIGMDEHQ